MKTLDFTIYIRHKGSKKEPWPERYQKETDDPANYGRELIEWFNQTCQPGERQREFIRAELHGDIPPPEHKWSKTSLMTQIRAGRAFDTMVCKHCHITGKRFGLNESIRRDSQYRAKIYARCDKAIEHLRFIKRRRDLEEKYPS